MKRPSSKKNTLLLLLFNFAILFTVYQVLIHLHPYLATILYAAAALALAVSYYVINRGFSPPVTDDEALPASWSPVEKCAYIEDAKSRHERAKGLLMWLLPVILTLLFDVLFLFVFDPLLKMLKL